MTDNTNTTAAQPLDLDFLEAMARNRLNGGLSLTSEEALALIAQARAAQPESATGTTGASIDTPEFRALLDEFAYRASERRAMGGDFGSADAEGEAEAALTDHIDAIIGDLRAQLAARGQGDESRQLLQEFVDYHSKPAGMTLEVAMDTDRLGTFLGGVEAREKDMVARAKAVLATPASAQPDRGVAQRANVCAEMRALCSNCGGTGEVHRADGEYIGTCDCMFQTIASPASQPVAPIYQVKSGLFPRGWHDISVEQMAPNEQAGFQTRTLYTAPVAVAPSDAKGKADAANAGGLREAFNRAFLSWNGFHTQAELAEEWEKGLSAVMFREGATSAADAKDAAQWTKTPPTEQADYWNWDGDHDHAPMIYHVLWSGTAKKCFVSAGQYGIDEAIWCDNFDGWWLKIEQPSIPSDRAAMAAAPSSAPGKEGEA